MFAQRLIKAKRQEKTEKLEKCNHSEAHGHARDRPESTAAILSRTVLYDSKADGVDTGHNMPIEHSGPGFQCENEGYNRKRETKMQNNSASLVEGDTSQYVGNSAAFDRIPFPRSATEDISSTTEGTYPTIHAVSREEHTFRIHPKAIINNLPQQNTLCPTSVMRSERENHTVENNIAYLDAASDTNLQPHELSEVDRTYNADRTTGQDSFEEVCNSANVSQGIQAKNMSGHQPMAQCPFEERDARYLRKHTGQGEEAVQAKSLTGQGIPDTAFQVNTRRSTVAIEMFTMGMRSRFSGLAGLPVLPFEQIQPRTYDLRRAEYLIGTFRLHGSTLPTIQEEEDKVIVLKTTIIVVKKRRGIRDFFRKHLRMNKDC